MALYVVDAREPVLNKYKDELTVLSWCAKPVMPVFNFVGGQDLSAWTTMLARRNLHVYSGFDTVAFDFEGEIRLWDNLATMLPERTVLDRLIAMRRREWHQLDGEAKREIAGFLLDVAAYRQETEADGASDGILQTMQAEVRQLERQLQQRLLQIYRFYQSGVDTAEWALKAFRQDPFDRDLLVQYGIRTGTGAATGALIGMGVDMVTLGGSLGLGAAIGGIIGGVLPNVQDISDKISGRQILRIDAETITLLAARAMDLLDALQKRGHAAQTPVRLQKNSRTPWQPSAMPSELNKARRQWKWSSLNTRRPEVSRREREEAVESLRQKLQ